MNLDSNGIGKLPLISPSISQRHVMYPIQFTIYSTTKVAQNRAIIFPHARRVEIQCGVAIFAWYSPKGD